MSAATEQDIEEGVDEIMEAIDDHALMDADVPRATSIAFLKGILEHVRGRMELVKSEAEADAGDDSDEESAQTD